MKERKAVTERQEKTTEDKRAQRNQDFVPPEEKKLTKKEAPKDQSVDEIKNKILDNLVCLYRYLYLYQNLSISI